MNSFFESELCKSRSACRKCRRSKAYRRGIVASFDSPEDVDFECPFGKSVEDFPQDIEPNLFEMGMNFGKAMAQEVKDRVQRKKVSSEEVERRISICGECEFLVNGRRCAKCGCVANLKARTVGGNCPIGKW